MNQLISDLETQAKAGINAFDEGQTEKAESILMAVLSIDGSHIGALRTLGTIHLQRQQFAAAELFVLKALLFGGPEPTLCLDAAQIAIEDNRFAHARVFMTRFHETNCTGVEQRQRAGKLAETLLEADGRS